MTCRVYDSPEIIAWVSHAGSATRIGTYIHTFPEFLPNFFILMRCRLLKYENIVIFHDRHKKNL